MSTNFPDQVYVPTGTADGKQYVQIGGYCYKKVQSNVTVSNEIINTSIVGDFGDCLDCNTCQCGKTIDFYVGGFSYSGANINFTEVKVPIKTSVSGWQEIAIESGFLNINPETQKADNSFSFKPTQIRCMDRKISMESGIQISFEERNAEITDFQYVSGIDLYERRDLRYHSITGGYGVLPTWDYLNQYDQVGIANTVNTIKFYNTCSFDCPTTDITFRLRGNIGETSPLYNVGGSYDYKSSAWVYLTCTGITDTPGQIIECQPSGTGLNFTDYFLQGIAPSVGHSVKLEPKQIEIVDMDLLLGNKGSELSKQHSVTGNLHFRDYWFGVGDNFSSYSWYSTKTGFYHLSSDTDFDNYSQDIGIPFGIHYNKPPNCFDASVHNSDFNTYYRHLGANTRATKGVLGTNIGDIYTGCFQASEFADGIFKNGTYTPMYFTGIITGNAAEYVTFIDANAGLNAPASWSTGIYVYQWYEGADRSDQANLTGYFGFLTGDFNDSELQKHYKSKLTNSTPINMDNPLTEWNIQSGSYPIETAKKVKSCIIANFNGQVNYKMSFQYSGSAIRHKDLDDGNRFDNYGFSAIGTNSAMEYLDDPIWPTNTLLNTDSVNIEYPLVDSGNAIHSDDTLINQTIDETITGQMKTTEIKSLKFQLKWNK